MGNDIWLNVPSPIGERTDSNMESLENESGGERRGNGELREDGEVLRVAEDDDEGFEECPGVNETIS